MKNYYEPGDKIQITSDEEFMHMELLEMYSDNSGRQKIIDDIKDTYGVVKATKPNMGHLEVLYMKNSTTHSWWIPTSLIIFTR